MKRLCCVLALTFVLLCVFATISLQLYMGSLRQKCISLHNLTSDSSFSHYYDDHNSSFNYLEHIQNRSTTLWNGCCCACVVDVCNLLFFFLRQQLLSSRREGCSCLWERLWRRVGDHRCLTHKHHQDWIRSGVSNSHTQWAKIQNWANCWGLTFVFIERNLTLLFCGVYWGLANKKLVDFRHQLMWSEDADQNPNP